MAPYDSDSSEDEGQDYTETNILLGYASKDPGDETVSRLGGRPDWLSPDKPPSAALARCRACGDLMVLLLQLNAELPDRFPGHERRLYVFACRRKACRRREGSVRVLRGVRVVGGGVAEGEAGLGKGKGGDVGELREKEKEKERERGREKEKKEAKPALGSGPGLGEALFGVSNPFGTASAAGANPFSSSGNRNPFSVGGGNPFSTSTPAPAPAPAAAEPTAAAAPAVAATASPTAPQDGGKEDEKKEKEKENLDAALNNLPKTFAETLSLNNPQAQAHAQPHGPPPPPEPWPPESSQPPAYPVRWIADAEYETLDPTPLPRVPAAAAAGSMDLDEPSSSSRGKEDKEVFESSMDATFQRFADRVGQNPEQVIRYEFGGQPLLYSKEDTVGKMLASSAAPPTGGVSVGVTTTTTTTSTSTRGIPRCGNCGAPRAFEVQLTPQAIAELEADEEGLDGMDWGTVIVGVCARDCLERGKEGEEAGEAGYLEEWAGVQWEELAAAKR